MLKNLNRARIPLMIALALALVGGGVYAASSLRATSVQLNISGGLTGVTDITGSTTSFNLNQAWSNSFTDGSGANQANKLYCKHAATTTTVDLDSTLTLCDGTTGAFSRIAGVYIKPATSNSAAITLGGDWILTKYLIPGGDTLANVTIPINKSGLWAFTAPDATGVAVTASTGDQLTLTVSGSDAFDLVIIGS